MQRFNTKTITMDLYDTIYTADISANMREGDEIYNTLRDAFRCKIGPLSHINIYHPERKELVRLSYNTLKEGTTYRIATGFERLQGPGTAGKGAKKALIDIETIMEHWQLTDASQTLPDDIAPSGNPLTWTRTITRELRSFSGRSKQRHAAAIPYLVKEVEDRVERYDDSPRQLSGGDIKRATEKMVKGMAMEAMEMLEEEEEANETFGGGLDEALAEAAMVQMGKGAYVWTAYEQEGKFTIAALDSKKQPGA